MSLDDTDASRRWCRWPLRNFDRRTFVMGGAAATGLTVVAAPLAFADTGDPVPKAGLPALPRRRSHARTGAAQAERRLSQA
jgi:hypothetical protein